MPTLLNPDNRTGTYYNAEPVCGEDFCDSCGDCLACYGNDDSCPNGSHSWYVYFEDREQWLQDHLNAKPL